MIFYRSFLRLPNPPTTKQLPLLFHEWTKERIEPSPDGIVFHGKFHREISRDNFFTHEENERNELKKKRGRRQGKRREGGGRKIDNATTRIQLTLPTEVCNATCASITRELRFPARFRAWNVSYSALVRLEKFSCENCEKKKPEVIPPRIIFAEKITMEISRPGESPLLIGT